MTDAVSFPDGTFTIYDQDDLFVWHSGRAHWLPDHFLAVDYDREWSKKKIRRPGARPDQNLCAIWFDYWAIDMRNKNDWYYRPVAFFLDDYGSQIFGYRNGLCRHYSTLGTLQSWRAERIGGFRDIVYPSSGFGQYLQPSFKFPFNPSRTGRDEEYVLWLFESPNSGETVIEGGIINNTFGEDFQAMYNYGQLSSSSNLEDIYIMPNNNTLRFSYLLSQINTIHQFESFRSKFSSGSFQILMTLIAKNTAKKCNSETQCSVLKGIDDVSQYVQTWLGSQPTGVVDAIKINICNSHPDLKECACLNRSSSSDYNLIASEMKSSDACWFLPCKDSKTYQITSDLQNPTCPEICQVIYKLQNINTLTFSNNINVLNCNKNPAYFAESYNTFVYFRPEKNLFLWKDKKIRWIQNNDVATTFDKNWSQNVVTKEEFEKPISALCQTKLDFYVLKTNNLDNLKAFYFKNKGLAIFGYRNNSCRQYLSMTLLNSWNVNFSPDNIFDDDFTSPSTQPFPFNPARIPGSDPNHVLWIFENSKPNELLITNSIDDIFGENIYLFAQLSVGTPQEDVYITYDLQSTPAKLKFCYLISQIKTLTQVENFILKFKNSPKALQQILTISLPKQVKNKFELLIQYFLNWISRLGQTWV